MYLQGKEQHELEIQKKKLNLGNPEEFRLRQQNAVLAREIMLDLKKAQFACHNLDAESVSPCVSVVYTHERILLLMIHALHLRINKNLWSPGTGQS